MIFWDGLFDLVLYDVFLIGNISVINLETRLF